MAATVPLSPAHTSTAHFRLTRMATPSTNGTHGQIVQQSTFDSYHLAQQTRFTIVCRFQKMRAIKSSCMLDCYIVNSPGLTRILLLPGSPIRTLPHHKQHLILTTDTCPSQATLPEFPAT